MICDKLKNLYKYPKFNVVYEFFKKIDGKTLTNGKYEIDENCYLVVSEYNTAKFDGLFEGHLKYIDLQMVIEGEEYIHTQEKSKCEVKKTYDSQKDAAFYSAKDWNCIYVGKGDFVVFDESDLHRPCISVNGETRVKKYVFKIKK